MARKKHPKNPSVDFKGAVRTAYKLGVEDGRQQAQVQLNALECTNREMFRILRELDEKSPLAGILISYDLAAKIIRALKKSVAAPNFARQLEELFQQQGGDAERKLNALARLAEYGPCHHINKNKREKVKTAKKKAGK